MHYLLVGPGALGCLLYSLISKGLSAGDRLTLLDYNQQRSELLTQDGIVYHNDSESQTVKVSATSDPSQLGHVDVVLLCVKSYDVINSLKFCKPILGEKTLLLFMQNGIGHLNLPDNDHKATAAYGITTEGATLLKAGHVRHAGSGHTFLGFLEPPDTHFQNALEKTQAALIGGGLQVQLDEDILSRIWGKLFVNVGINALTAILGCKNGELLTLPGIAPRMQRAVEEAILIAKTKKILTQGDPYQATRGVCNTTAANVSSMLQDVRKKRKTEIGAINGAIVSLGKQFGIDTPENRLLSKQVKELEAAYNH